MWLKRLVDIEYHLLTSNGCNVINNGHDKQLIIIAGSDW